MNLIKESWYKFTEIWGQNTLIQAVGRHAGPVQVLELINNCLKRCPIRTGLLISSESNSITA